MNRNRRKQERTELIGASCAVKLGHGEAKGHVVDDSIEGVRIGGLSLLVLLSDQKVRVEFDGQSIVGRCRGVSRDADGTFQVGVFRETEDFVEDIHSILVNSFVQLGDQKIVCIPLAVEEAKTRIRLLDREEFAVPGGQISQATRQERLEELCDTQRLSEVMQIYEMMGSHNEFTDRGTVLNHEFGPPVRSLSAVLS